MSVFRLGRVCTLVYGKLLANNQNNIGIIGVASQKNEGNVIENPDANDRNKELMVEDIRDKAFDNFEEIRENDYVELEKTPGEDEGEYYVRFIIKDPVNFNKEINEVVKMMDEKDLTYEEVFENEL